MYGPVKPKALMRLFWRLEAQLGFDHHSGNQSFAIVPAPQAKEVGLLLLMVEVESALLCW